MTPEDVAQITAIVDASEQRLNARLAASEERLNARLDASVQSIVTATQAEIKAAKDEAIEVARDVETKLLTAFHGHAKGQTARLHTFESITHD